MRTTTIASAAALLIGGAAVLTFAAPAFAATVADTPVTVQITGGALGISAPAGPVNLGSAAASADVQTVTGLLGLVAVTDLRAGIAGWVATAGSSAFTGPTALLGSAAAYAPGTAVVTGTATVTATNLASMITPGTTQTATAVLGVNTATWNPSITVTLPAGAQAGTYGATITHSVS